MSEEEARRPLFNRGFISLSITQFFGASNDYLLKTLLTFALAASGIWRSKMGEGGQVYPAYSLVIPFLLFCVLAGQIADRHSKQAVTVRVKQAEIFFALMAFAGFWMANFWLCLAAMVFLGIQSAFFSPAKYGLIPELVDEKDLSRANGIINMLTNLAAIFATVVGSYLYEQYTETKGSQNVSEAQGPMGMLWLPGLVMLGVALLGLVASLWMPKLKARNPDSEMQWNIFGSVLSTLREMKASGNPILIVAALWSMFYLIAYTIMLILPDYTKVLDISVSQVGLYLLGPMGICIGLGSALAGWISGSRIQPRFVPAGAIGLTICFLLLGWAPAKLWVVVTYIALMGICAGFYIVPLQALMQKLSPDESRGRFLGAAAAMASVFEIIGIGVFHVSRRVFDIPSQRIFLIVGVLSLAATILFYWKVRRHIHKPEWQ